MLVVLVTALLESIVLFISVFISYNNLIRVRHISMPGSNPTKMTQMTWIIQMTRSSRNGDAMISLYVYTVTRIILALLLFYYAHTNDINCACIIYERLNPLSRISHLSGSHVG